MVNQVWSTPVYELRTKPNICTDKGDVPVDHDDKEMRLRKMAGPS